MDASALIESAVNQWEGVIRRAAFRSGGTSADLDEILQDIRIRLWRALEREGENRGGFPPSYVYMTAMSATVDLLRRRRGTRKPVTTVPIESVAETLPAPAGEVRDDSLVARLAEALQGLLPERRVAVQLHLQGKDRDAIAGLTGWSEAKTRNLLYRGLADLKARLT